MSRIAQIVTATGFVQAVAISDDIPVAPDGITFVELGANVPNPIGKYYINGVFSSTANGSPTPVELSFGDFQDLCARALGSVVDPTGDADTQFIQGVARYGEIIKDVFADSTGLGRAIQDRYTGGMSSGFRYDKTMQFLVLINGYLQAGEFDAIVGQWPKV